MVQGVYIVYSLRLDSSRAALAMSQYADRATSFGAGHSDTSIWEDLLSPDF